MPSRMTGRLLLGTQLKIIIMKFKNLLLFFVVLIILIAGVFCLFKYKDSLQKNVKDNPSIETDKITIQDKQIIDNTKPFKINIAYPEAIGLDDFNQKSKAIVDKKLSDFKTNSLENDNAVKTVDPESYAKYPREYDLNIGYDKGEISDNVVSVVFNIYAFEGGANGNSYFVSLNYNPGIKEAASGEPRPTGREIKLADMFVGQENYLQKISDYCTKDLTKQLTTIEGADFASASWIGEGAGPNEENFSNFLINKDSIVFYFSKYQVAPGAAGDFKVTMPK
jgi:uncharacterized protein YneF (UPF0154 family)